jgi:Fe-S cluster assembly protein SufD
LSSVETFKNLFETLKDQSSDRKKAFACFESMGLPTRSDESWKYTSLKPISKDFILPRQSKIQNAIKKNLEDGLVGQNEISISCVNGYFDIESIKTSLSPYKIEVMSLSEALSQGLSQALSQGLSQNKIKRLDTKDSFLALNSAFYENGLFLSLAKGERVDKAIVIRYGLDQGANFVNPRIYIEMNDESSMEFAEVFEINSTEYLLNSSLEIKIGKRASLKALKHYNENDMSTHVDNTYIDQADSSSCQVIQWSKGSQLLRQNLEVNVNGSDAHTDLRGISILENSAQMDNYVKIHHKAPGSTSRQAFKSILRDQSHYVFQGNIRIDSVAQKTDSDQINRNLMLGQKCRVDTKPQLDVFADDVKATHGAAIGQLNPDEKFYLESRCISPEKALEMLCAGFALDLLEGLKSVWIKNYLLDRL